LERRLFARPADEWTPDDWFSFFGTAQILADKYGRDQVLTLVNELVSIGAGATAATADAIRHSIRA
jgi:hypothetical protein